MALKRSRSLLSNFPAGKTVGLGSSRIRGAGADLPIFCRADRCPFPAWWWPAPTTPGSVTKWRAAGQGVETVASSAPERGVTSTPNPAMARGRRDGHCLMNCWKVRRRLMPDAGNGRIAQTPQYLLPEAHGLRVRCEAFQPCSRFIASSRTKDRISIAGVRIGSRTWRKVCQRCEPIQPLGA